MPAAYMDKLKNRAVLVGDERTASSQFSNGQLIWCALHGPSLAKAVLHLAKVHELCCQSCIENECTVSEAKTEEKARGYWEDLRE